MNNLSNLTLRIIFGLLGAALVALGVFVNEWTFFALTGAICTLSLYEFYNLLYSSNLRQNRFFGVVIGISLFSIHYLVNNNTLPNKAYFILFPLFMVIFLIELFQTNENPFQRIAYTALGLVYIAIPLAMFSTCSFMNTGYNKGVAMGILLLLWGNDIGGYIAGLSFGKHKLFERVSPKKTWEGSFGGLVLSMVTAFVLSEFIPALPLSSWLIISALMVIFGSLGDLVESLFKRNLAVKDSGNLIPGHGGFLDRFDGLFMASPFIMAYLKLFVL